MDRQKDHLRKVSFAYRIGDLLYFLLVAGILLGLASCTKKSAPVKAEQPAFQEEERLASQPEQPNELKFIDSGTFDRKLSMALRKVPQTFTTTFVGTVTTNHIPERLDKWFSMVEKHGGTVDVEPEKEELAKRGLIGEAISLVVGAYNFMKEKAIYSPVQRYNVTIFYKKGTGEITRVVFNRKDEEKGEG